MNRETLVARMRGRLEWGGWPRVVVFLLVLAAGATGFLMSFVLLSAGYESMALRYGIAGVSGYVAFLALLGAYVMWQRRFAFDRPDALDAMNLLDAGGSFGTSLVDATNSVGRFAGGRSGGGGASGSWGSASADSGARWFDGDVDLGWVLIAAAVALAGVLAVGYVVWAAPVLLAEVLVDALIVGAVSRRLTDDRHDWTVTAIRRTWLPATILIATLVVAGWALQAAAPEARSIGPAVRAILGQ